MQQKNTKYNPKNGIVNIREREITTTPKQLGNPPDDSAISEMILT